MASIVALFNMRNASPQETTLKNLKEQISGHMKYLDASEDSYPYDHITRFPLRPSDLPPDVLEYAYGSDHPIELSETEVHLLNKIGSLKCLRGTSTRLKAASIDARGRAAPPIQLNVGKPSLCALQDTAPPNPQNMVQQFQMFQMFQSMFNGFNIGGGNAMHGGLTMIGGGNMNGGSNSCSNPMALEDEMKSLAGWRSRVQGGGSRANGADAHGEAGVCGASSVIHSRVQGGGNIADSAGAHDGAGALRCDWQNRR
jgi:hypothetical protein